MNGPALYGRFFHGALPRPGSLAWRCDPGYPGRSPRDVECNSGALETCFHEVFPAGPSIPAVEINSPDKAVFLNSIRNVMPARYGHRQALLYWIFSISQKLLSASLIVIPSIQGSLSPEHDIWWRFSLFALSPLQAAIWKVIYTISFSMTPGPGARNPPPFQSCRSGKGLPASTRRVLTWPDTGLALGVCA